MELKMSDGDRVTRLAVSTLSLGQKVDKILQVQAEHTQTLNGHTRILDEHTQILNEHTTTLNEHTKILDEHTRILDEHTTTLNEHTRILGEHTRTLGEHGEILATHTKQLTNLENGQAALLENQFHMNRSLDAILAHLGIPKQA
jgi:ATP-dependent 26S proteasome regulatory subunit